MIVSPEAPKPGEVAPDVENNPAIEQQWVMKAVKHSETYIKIITSMPDNTKLRLTDIDDEIYFAFRASFPDLKVDVLTDDILKSEEAKKKWAPFMMGFENKLDLFNFLTMLRLNCKLDYTEENTTVVPRIQFLAIELARLREGLNKDIKRED